MKLKTKIVSLVLSFLLIFSALPLSVGAVSVWYPEAPEVTKVEYMGRDRYSSFSAYIEWEPQKLADHYEIVIKNTDGTLNKKVYIENDTSFFLKTSMELGIKYSNLGEAFLIRAVNEVHDFGSNYCSEYTVVPITEPTTHESYEIKEENGWQYIERYGNAIIRDYLGDRATLLIPDTLGGKPVVGIELCGFPGQHEESEAIYPKHTFSNPEKITSITIPGGLRYITRCPHCAKPWYGDGGYAHEEFCEKLYKEYGMDYYLNTLFRLMPNLKSISVADGNTIFKSIEGVLYSKNGKYLLTYPQNKQSKDFTVISGTETIMPAAFNLSETAKLQKLILPESVKTVHSGQYVYNNVDIYLLNSDAKFYQFKDFENKDVEGRAFLPLFGRSVIKLYAPGDSQPYLDYLEFKKEAGEDAGVILKEIIEPAKPKKLTVTKKTSGEYYNVTLKWSEVKGADGYKIRVKDENGKFTTLGYTENLSFKLKQSVTKTQKYYIKAYKEYHEGKFYGSNKTSTVKKKVWNTKPGSISTIKTVSYQKYLVTLTWKKVEGADGYKIRVKDEKGKFKTLGYSTQNRFVTHQSVLDTSKYYVKAYKQYKDGKYYSKNKTVTVKKETAPSKPKNLKAKKKYISSKRYSVILSWDGPKPSPNYNLKYKVKVYDIDAKEFVQSFITTSTKTSPNLIYQENGKNYKYYVKAYKSFPNPQGSGFVNVNIYSKNTTVTVKT